MSPAVRRLASVGLYFGLQCLVALGCGPSVGFGDDTGSGTGEPPAGSDETSAMSASGSDPGTSTSTSTSTGTSTSTSAGTSTSTTTGAPDASDDDVGDAGFIWPLDASTPAACSLFAQDCPRGEKCSPFANDGGAVWNVTRCVPLAADPASADEPCHVQGDPTSGLDDCDETSMCMFFAGEIDEGRCVPFCSGSEREPTCTDTCRRCSIGQEAAIAVCMPSCEPLGAGCPDGFGCYPVDGLFECIFAGAAEPGQPCDSVNACAPGSACMPTAEVPGCEDPTGCCTPMCSTEGDDPCASLIPGTACTPLRATDPSCGSGVGACRAE